MVKPSSQVWIQVLQHHSLKNTTCTSATVARLSYLEKNLLRVNEGSVPRRKSLIRRNLWPNLFGFLPGSTKTKNWTEPLSVAINGSIDLFSVVSNRKKNKLGPLTVKLKQCYFEVEQHSTVVRICASGPSSPGSIPGIPKTFSEKIFREKIVVVAQVNQQRCCLEQWTAEA